MVHIPYDIWLVIVRFLPEETVQGLLGLDRVCFDTVMDHRYRVVDIRNGGRDKGNHRCLLRLQDGFVARRVRILHISSAVFLPQPPEVLRRGLVSKMADAAKQALLKRYLPARTTTEAADELASAFARMSALSELYLYCETPAEASLPLVSVMWNVFGSNLRCLSLNGTLHNIADALHSPIVFESLECMALHLGPTDLSSDPGRLESMSRRIASFINGHYTTLRDLELTYKFDFDSPSKLSFILDGLGHFSCLQTFRLQASLDTGLGLPALRNIIIAHQHQLITLIITHRLPATSTFWEGITLPILESLNLAMNPEDPRMIEAVIALLNSLEPSLIGFKLSTDYQLSCPELRSILGVFTAHSKLRRLALPLEFLSLQVLELVAERLPQVQLKLVNSHFIVG